MKYSVSLIALLWLSVSVTAYAGKKEVSLSREGNKVIVSLGGQKFTEYVHGEQKPYLYPVMSPAGTSMTRKYPFVDNVEGERKDHPWHTGIYYTHGSVNGHDFWNDKKPDHKAARIVLDKIEKIDNPQPEIGRVIATHKWMFKDKVQMTDRTQIRFFGDNNGHYIEFDITLMASEGPVTLGDTKEGCMAFRMHHKLRTKDQGAKAANSAGDTGDIWGKKAKWISYANTIDGKVQGVTLLDHAQNPQHPTTWHARNYGLAAANSFGLKYFQGKKHNGTVKLEKGDKLRFRFLIAIHLGSHEDIPVEKMHTAWSEGKLD